MMIKKIQPITVLLLVLVVNVNCLAQTAWTNYSFTNSPLPENSVRCIEIDALNRKWIGTDYGLAIFDDVNWTVYFTTNSGLPDNAIRAITFDSNNNAWIGTLSGGLTKFDGTNWTTYNTSNSSLPANYVKALEVDTTGFLWIGTQNGIAKFDMISNWVTFTPANSILITANIASIHVRTNNQKIIGTLNGGLIIFANDTIKDVLTIANGSGIPDNTQLDLAEDSLGNVWFATAADGLAAYRGQFGWFWYHPGISTIPSPNLSAVHFNDTESILWIGSIDNGLIKKTGASFSAYTTSNSLIPDNHIQSLTVDNSNVVWMGTASNGVVRFDETLLSSTHSINNAGSILLYPNPTTGDLFFKAEETFTAIKIYDVSGRIVYSKQTSVGNNKIDLSEWDCGVFFVEVVAKSGESYFERIVKLD
ncbi:MAG TPA: two-component regulator propeller domain-containing protein [Bacteroidia bacterium]|nr:two-component regulator propeller domain-containing protein [Bacteroidia bacterium]HNU33400.1 two-component regulator propeller domain-containing protein [Bacteroidia bacterium]